ncbi:DUF3298 and DUF4163 domain-containing protein [Ilyobacter polytropus]|uniref:DUF3298 domain-containing protein n=1 Tax=Ilyobacter polytropus (strain ATCC 51220 / DSM 2926 / LMG 16218 / CuHBu1) TaxID=572544 RepID=E3HDJ5_ILYPC|nr:DUF3298 and DUF4163 domain-containing protein [Ilyobacter polytropus]ADO84181.1 conserved hypothetical protein [Ilyobacter polytropus DSM 2926]
MKKIIVFIFIFAVFQNMFSVETKKSNIKLENQYLMIDGKIPVFYNKGKYIGNSSNKVKGGFRALMEMIKMESNKNRLENPDNRDGKFILKSDFKKIDNESKIDSYLVKTFYFTGGSHGMILEEGYNFKNGKEIFLKDIFKGNINYKGLIKQKVEEQIIKYGGDLYYADINIPDEEYSFYFEGDSLVVFFNPYTLASYEAGIITFEIPISEISSFMKI